MDTQSSTGSPISIDITTASPIRTYGNMVEFPLVVTVKNIGGGIPCFGSSHNCKKPGGLEENEDWNRIAVKIILPDGLAPAQNSCKANGNEIEEQIIFVGRDPQTITCRVTANIGSQTGFTQKNIEAVATYGYFIDKSSSVKVYPSTKPNSPAK